MAIGDRRRARRRHPRLAVAVLVAGLALAAVSGYRVYTAVTPRTFTAAQQQQIMTWEVAARWRELPAGTIFPARTTYSPPDTLQDGGQLTLTTRRLGIARQATCRQATDATAAALLDRNGCAAVLRASYVDGTGTYLVTVGVAAFASTAQATVAQGALTSPRISHAGQRNHVAPGVRAATLAGTPAAGFTDARRQLSGSVNEGPYVVMYTVGYTDNRPKVPVAVDSYTYSEMTSMGRGLADTIADALAAPPSLPHCPGATGC